MHCSTKPHFLSFCHVLYLPVSYSLSVCLSQFLYYCFCLSLSHSLSLTYPEASRVRCRGTLLFRWLSLATLSLCVHVVYPTVPPHVMQPCLAEGKWKFPHTSSHMNIALLRALTATPHYPEAFAVTPQCLPHCVCAQCEKKKHGLKNICFQLPAKLHTDCRYNFVLHTLKRF